MDLAIIQSGDFGRHTNQASHQSISSSSLFSANFLFFRDSHSVLFERVRIGKVEAKGKNGAEDVFGDELGGTAEPLPLCRTFNAIIAEAVY